MAFNPLAMMKFKDLLSTFSAEHPKFTAFLAAAGEGVSQEGAQLDIKVTTVDGRVLQSNLKVTENDIKLIEALKSLKE